MSAIVDIVGREILDSRGNPTVECDVLLESGVKIHLYRPAFLHAKHVTIDDTVAMVGSTNMDIRSFALNAESALVIYDRDVVEKMVRIQQRYLAASDTVVREKWTARPLRTPKMTSRSEGSRSSTGRCRCRMIAPCLPTSGSREASIRSNSELLIRSRCSSQRTNLR